MSRETRRMKRNSAPAASDEAQPPKKWGGPRPNSGRPRKEPVKAISVPAEPKAAASKPGLDFARMAAVMPELLELSERYGKQKKRTAENNPFKFPWFPEKAMPPENHRMAMDSLPAFTEASQGWLAGSVFNGLASEGLLFPGYTYLSELAQRPEYRIIAETIADDATRKWVKTTVVGEEKRKEIEESKKPKPAMDADEREEKIKKSGKAQKIKDLDDFMEQLKVRDRFYARCRDDGFFGRTHLYLDVKGAGVGEGDPAQLKVSIGNGRSDASKALVNKGTPLRDLRVIEPVWTYPMAYNASNPLIADWYNPQFWYVMGQELHVSRILPLVSRPVPDILKPAYAFGGLSLSQIAQPYVDIWLQTRASVAALIHAFSVMVLETDLQTTLQPNNAGGLIMRAMLFNALRDNQGLMIVNQATEDFKNVSAPLSGLSDLQAQSQEHVASIARIPLVKYTGLQPKGLNASSEGEIRVYYDTIVAYQHRSIRPDLTIIYNFAQLSLFGEVDPDISFDFEPLWEMSQKEKSEKEKDDAERDDKYIAGGVLHPEEVRTRIANDPTLPYTDIDPGDVPDLAEEEEEGLDPGALGGGKKGGGGSSSEEGGEQTANDNDPFGALDEFNESDHPRGQPGNAGQFGPGGGGGSTSAKAKSGAKPSKHNQESGGSVMKPTFKGWEHKKPLSPKNLTKVGEKMGSNDGGTFKDKETGKEFYIKKPQSPAHVTNELLGAKLYQMAGGNTLNYQPVEGGGHVATELAKLDKKNVNDFTPAEKKAAQKDFAVQAWIGNWDAAGTGGDNKGILGGKPTALDFGGALEYRAQGEPKGDAFGKQVNEITTMTDPLKSPDNAALYGSMTMAEQKASAKQVTDLTNDEIITAVKEAGGTADLAQKLIDRKASLANMYGLMTDLSAWDDAKHPRNPDGTFAKGSGGEEPPAAAAATGEEGEVLKPGAYGGLWKAGSDGTPEGDFAHNAGFYAKAKTQIGIHYRRMLAKLIKDAPAQGLESAVPDLKNKLIESLGLSYQKLVDKGDAAGAKKLGETLSKLVGSGPAPVAEKPAAPKPAPKSPDPLKAQPLATVPGKPGEGIEVKIFAGPDGKTFNAVLWDTESNQMISANTHIKTMADAHTVAEKMIHGPGGKPAEPAPAPKQKAAAEKPPEPVSKATPEELKKAKKGTTVPISTSNPDAVALIKEFNEKYAGKELSDPKQLEAKVAEYKVMSQKVKGLAEAEQSKIQAKVAAEHAAMMKNPDYAGLAGVVGVGNMKEYLQSGAIAAATLKEHGINVTDLEGAYLRSYIGAHYSDMNEQLYSGAVTPEQYAYRKGLQRAMEKMPVYAGKVERGVKNITPAQFAQYKAGHIVPTPAFMSAGKKEKLWGHYTLEIQSKTARDISILNPGEGGGEVVFMPHTAFKVVSNKGNKAVLEEVD